MHNVLKFNLKKKNSIFFKSFGSLLPPTKMSVNPDEYLLFFMKRLQRFYPLYVACTRNNRSFTTTYDLNTL